MAAPRKSNYRLPDNRSIAQKEIVEEGEEEDVEDYYQDNIEEEEVVEELSEDDDYYIPKYKPTPNKFDINKIKDKREEIIFKDQYGNLYGLLDETHALHNQLVDSGEIDDEYSFLAWISLPRLVRSNESTYSSFPPLGEIISIYNGHNNQYIRDFIVKSYPERRKPKSRSSCVILGSNI